MEEIEYETELTFAQVDYLVSLSVFKVSSFDAEYNLVIDIESKSQGLIWRGEYKQKYVEEITNKAGNYKKFGVFVKMLMAAIKRDKPDEVAIDLLTQQDLALIKARKQNPRVQSAAPELDHTDVDPHHKRYLILTLSGEFEKVHYPLPLAFLEEPDIATLRKTFQRMQSEVSLMQNSRAFSEMGPLNDKPSMSDFTYIEDENANMRQDIDEMERVFSQTDNQFFTSQRETLEMESQFEEYQREAEVEISRLAKIVDSKESELMNLQRNLNRARGTHQSGFSLHNQSLGVQSDAESVRTQLLDLNQELETEQRKATEVISKQDEELTEARTKAEEGQEQQRKMRARMVELQNELEQTIKRIEQVQRGGGGFGARANARMNFNGASQGSRNSSNASRGPSNSSANRVNRFGGGAPANNRPVPNYMKPRGQTNSADRAGSGAARSNSNKARFLPSNYKPPHLRGNNSSTRISPARQNGVQSSGYGPNNRVSPNTRQPVTGANQGNTRRSPGSRLYANVQSRLHNPAPRLTRDGAPPVQNQSQERKAANRVSPVAPNRFGVNYRGERGTSNNRSNSRDNRIPKVNNYTKVMQRISPARAAVDGEGDNRSGVFDRLYGRSKPAIAAKSASRERNLSNNTRQIQSNGGPPRANAPRQFNSQSRLGNNNTGNRIQASSRPTMASGQPKPSAPVPLPKSKAQDALASQVDVETKDIDSKLDRLQDLLKMAKNN